VCATVADGSPLRRNAGTSGEGNAEIRERRGDCPDDPGTFGIVLARGLAGRPFEHKAHHAGSPGGVIHERVANLRRGDCARKALFGEKWPFFNVESQS
jgi:hypothetical protein